MLDQPSVVLRRVCQFDANGDQWRCRECGRTVPKRRDKPPVATCRAGDGPREVRLCKFGPDGRCEVCGLSMPVPENGGALFAVCGQPETARVIMPPKVPAGGPGTELKRLLSLAGFTEVPGCKCNERAKIMDLRGVEWCEQNIDKIVGWLREEATKRRLPFLDAAGRVLVRQAIRNAKRAKSSP